MLKVLILDFDGVVIESNDVKRAGFAYVFSSFPEHAAIMMDYHDTNVSMGRYEKFDYLLGRLGRTGDWALRTKIATGYSRFVADRLQQVPMVPGAMRLLANFSHRLPVYLASVTPIEDLTQTLISRDLKKWFRDVYGCPPWTKPNAIRDVLAREQVSPQDAVLVGDSAGDQKAAYATGVRFIARDSGLAFEAPQPKQFADLNGIYDHLYQMIK